VSTVKAPGTGGVKSDHAPGKLRRQS